VVVVLGVLTLLGMVSVAWLTNRARKSTTHEDAGQATLPEGKAPDGTMVVLQAALDHLAEVAQREANESAEARREAATLRRQLEQSTADFQAAKHRAEQAEASLAACRERAQLLSERARHVGGEEHA
jgi:hypothetical protein